MLGIVAKPVEIRVSIRQTKNGIKVLKNPETYFIHSKRIPEINKRNMNRGTIFPEEPDSGSRERFLRFKTFLIRPDRIILPAKVSSRAKNSRYVKIKG